jgi:tetratricopeptide (TPR) repeat protein
VADGTLDAEFDRAYALHEAGELEHALAAYGALAGRWGASSDMTARVATARARRRQGLELVALERDDEGLALFEQVVAAAGRSGDPGLRRQVRLARTEAAELLERLGRTDEAIATFDALAGSQAGADDDVSRNVACHALARKAMLLDQLGRHEPALAARLLVVEQAADAAQPELRRRGAWQLYRAGVTLERLGRPDEALAHYDRVAGQYADDGRIDDGRALVARALVRKANVLDALGRHDEELAARRAVVEREQAADDPEMRLRVARERVNIACTLRDLELPDEELPAYREAFDRYASEPAADLVDQATRALLSEGLAFARLERLDQAIASFELLIERFRSSPDDRVRLRVYRSANAAAGAYEQLGRTEDALRSVAWLAAITAEPGSEIALSLLTGRVNEGICLAALDRREEAHAVFAGIGPATGDVPAAVVHEHLRAGSFDAVELDALGRAGDAIDRLQGVADAYGGGEPTAELCTVLLQLGKLLRREGRHGEAGRVFRSAFERFADASQIELQRHAAWAGATAMRQFHATRDTGATTAMAVAVRTRFRGSDDEYIRARVRNVATVAIVMPRVQRTVDLIDRVPPSVGAGAGAALAAAVWLRARARRR